MTFKCSECGGVVRKCGDTYRCDKCGRERTFQETKTVDMSENSNLSVIME
jgi:hypothetical protein